MTVYRTRQAFGMKIKPLKRGVMIFVAALAATSVTVSIPALGRTQTVTMSLIGNDRGTPDGAGETHAFRYGSVTFNDLAHFTKYEFTVTQGATTRSGSFRTLPGMKDNFRFFVTSCLFPSPTTDPTQGNVDRVAGAHNYIRQQIESGPLPVAGMLHADDLCYSDRFNKPSDSVIGKTQTGLPEATLKQYDYGLTYATLFGLLQPDVAPAGDFALLDDDYLWTCENTGQWYQDGDHEYTNDIQPQNTATPNSYHATPNGYDGAGLVVFNAVARPFSGTSARSADVNAHHWYQDLGPLRLIVTDPTCNYDLDLAVPANSVSFGNNQIADLKAVWHSPAAPFKLLVNPLFGLREPVGEANYKDGTNGFGTPDDYINLYRDTASNSVNQSPYTNGTGGICAVARGDWHVSGVYTFKKAASAGQAKESLTEINIGASSGSITFSFPSSPSNTTIDDVLYEFIPTESVPFSSYCVLQADVYGAETPPRMVLSLIRSPRLGLNGGVYIWTTAWSRTYKLYETDNLGAETNVASLPNVMARIGRKRAAV